MQFMVAKLLQKGSLVQKNTIVVKFSGDSTNLTSSGLKSLNFTFTLIDDPKFSKSHLGNYIIGNLCFYKVTWNRI